MRVRGTTSPGSGTTALLDRSIGWLTEHLDWFRPATWDAHFPPRDFPGTTALELLLLCRSLGPRHRDFTAAAADLAEEVVADPAFLDGLRAADEQFTYHAWLVGLLHRLGRPVPWWRAEIARVLRRGEPWDARAPWRDFPAWQLELRYALDLCAVDCRLPAVPDLFARCGIADRDPALVDDETAYEITHVLFYATDFGRAPVPFADEGARRRTGQLVLALVERYRREGHFDLVAELLLCAALTGAGGAAATAEGWRRLLAAQHERGTLPGPPFREAVLTERSGLGATSYVFRTCYHTTVVSALAAAARDGEEIRP
ncbi:hypothetical protein GCM10023222_42110 [Saccharopolyspora cebuensis]